VFEVLGEQGQGDQKGNKQDRGQAFPEQQRIALDERLCRRVANFLLGYRRSKTNSDSSSYR
jgi:hypothetical protein